MYQGKNALVTGAASGIGRRLSEHLIQNGARVVCADINRRAGEEIVKQLNADHGQLAAFFVETNVTNWEAVVSMFTKADALLGNKLDFVFANAGCALIGFPNVPGEPDTTVLDVNLKGVLYTMQAAINHFRAHKSGGRIVVTASQSSLHPLAVEPIYTASKHGVLGLVRATALRTEKEQIYINAVGPGSTSSSLMPPLIENAMKSQGWGVSKETIMEAFNIFLQPDCKLTGNFAEAIGEHATLYKFPIPTMDRLKSKL